MKSLLQVVVPLLILMGAVAGISYFSQYATKKKIDPSADVRLAPVTTPTNDRPLLNFDNALVDVENRRPIEVEPQSYNHKDFWFHTEQDQDVEVGLWFQSCKCADVELGSFDLTQDEADALANAPTLRLLCRLAGTVKFQKLPNPNKGEGYTPLRKTSNGKSPLPYVARVNWKTEAKTPADPKQAVKIEVAARVGNGQPSIYKHEFEYQVVPATAMWPATVELGEIRPGGQASRVCVVWSVTRERLNFNMQLNVPRGALSKIEPCAVVSSPELLTATEMAALPKSLGREFASLRPLCAYRFRLTLHERKGEHQLEMGPINRQLVIKHQTAAGEPRLGELKAPVTAVVRGDVTILNGDENGRIQLGNFSFDGSKSYSVRLGSLDPKLDLEVEPSSVLEKTKATLSSPQMVGGRREWDLRIDIEPVAFLGDFSWSLALKTKGPNPRRLLIPIIGNAERR